MAISDLTSPTAVKQAIKECDFIGRAGFLRKYGFVAAQEYVLRYRGQAYDSKAIAGVAHGLQNPELGALKPNEFSGGIASGAAATRIFDLGFEVDGKKRGAKDWSLDECEQTAGAYFKCLQHKIRGEKFNRAAACNVVASQIGRTKGAIDYKFQNIDAILLEHDLPRLNNAVASNVQRLLRFVVLDPLAQYKVVFSEMPSTIPEPPDIKDVFVPVPRIDVSKPRLDAQNRANRVVVLDFALLDAQNRRLGKKGEEWVLALEHRRLTELGMTDLALGIRWVSESIGDGLGYDIESFDGSGNRLFIEVKTTNAGATVPFFISPHELAVAEHKNAAYRLYRVFNFCHEPRIFVIEGPLSKKLRLQTHLYSAVPVTNSLGYLGRLAHVEALKRYAEAEDAATIRGRLLERFKDERSPAIRWYIATHLVGGLSTEAVCTAIAKSFCDCEDFWPLRKRLGDMLLDSATLPSMDSAILLATLRDDALSVRWRAAELLRRTGIEPNLIEVIARELIENPCKHVRWRLVELIRDSGERSSQILIALLLGASSTHHWVQWHSLDMLRNSYTFSDILAVATSPRVHEHRGLLSSALQELCRCHPIDGSLSVIEQALTSSPDPILQANVIDGLRRTGVAALYVEALLRVLDGAHPAVRARAAQALGECGAHVPVLSPALSRHMDNDNDAVVRMWSARALISLGHVSTEAVESLLPFLTEREHGLTAWNSLVNAISQNDDFTHLLTGCDPADLSWLIAEDLAQGVLPTIGIKYWTEWMPISLPTRLGKNRATDRGIYHSWESHSHQVEGRQEKLLTQVCLHADWFLGIHLIWVADYILSATAAWDLRQSPASIEGREVGFLLQGGGNLWELPGMRKLGTAAKADRIDFLRCKSTHYPVFDIRRFVSPLKVFKADPTG